MGVKECYRRGLEERFVDEKTNFGKAQYMNFLRCGEVGYAVITLSELNVTMSQTFLVSCNKIGVN